MARYRPDAYIVVMAVDSKGSLDQAERILAYLRMSGALEDRTVVLVANKTDLVKSRAIKPLEGKQVAIHYNIKYIETSPGKSLLFSRILFLILGINHNVDELLVGVLTQIRLRRRKRDKNRNNNITKVRDHFYSKLN